MMLREWWQLALTRRVFRRRFVCVPVVVFIVASVVYPVVLVRYVEPRLMPVMVGSFQHWEAEYDEARDEFVVTHRMEDEWLRWSRIRYDALVAEQDVPWAADFMVHSFALPLTAGASGRWFGTIQPPQPDVDEERLRHAAAAIAADYKKSRLGSRYPRLFELALDSPDSWAELHRFSPFVGLVFSSVPALWLLTIVAVLGAFTPRRGELAEYRRKRGQCVRCRYDLRQLSGDVCTECGAAQGVAA